MKLDYVIATVPVVDTETERKSPPVAHFFGRVEPRCLSYVAEHIFDAHLDAVFDRVHVTDTGYRT